MHAILLNNMVYVPSNVGLRVGTARERFAKGEVVQGAFVGQKTGCQRAFARSEKRGSILNDADVLTAT